MSQPNPAAPFSTISVTGSFVPETLVGNVEIEDRCQLERGWIEQRTGIQTRPYARPDQAVSDLAIGAGSQALEHRQATNRDHSPIGMLILATSTPDYLLPPTAPFVADQLGLGEIPAFDMAVACSGFLYALKMADGFCRTSNQPAMVIAANLLSKRVSPNDPATAAIFADGAGAVVVEPAQQPGIVAIKLESRGAEHDALLIPHGGSKHPFDESTLSTENHKMKVNNGMGVFRYAVESMSRLGQEIMEEHGVLVNDIDYWIPHQANLRIIDSVRERLGIPREKTAITIDQLANSSAATIPTALDRFIQLEKIKPNDLVLMTTAAAGLTSGAALVRIASR